MCGLGNVRYGKKKCIRLAFYNVHIKRKKGKPKIHSNLMSPAGDK